MVFQKTYITGSMSGSFGSNNRDGIRLQVITLSNQLLPSKLVVILKSHKTYKQCLRHVSIIALRKHEQMHTHTVVIYSYICFKSELKNYFIYFAFFMCIRHLADVVGIALGLKELWDIRGQRVLLMDLL